MKTNFLKVFIVLFVGILALEGCTKKGENDPFISLKSRDGRVTGEWKLVSYESTSTDVNTSGSITVSETKTDSYDGTIWTRTNPGGTNSYSYSRDIIIEKEGTYTFKESEDGDLKEDNGRWSWLDDAKKKRRILFDGLDIFYIDQLKNKEMVLTQDYEDNYTDSNGDSGKYTYTSRAVYEKQ